MTLPLGSKLGHFEILAPLGAGGMGEVYRAKDTRLDREVAIKVLPESTANDAEALARFDREAKAVAALSHPNILALHDFGKENGVVYAVMELLEGETLRAKLQGSALQPRKTQDYAKQIADGLAAAHEKGIIHRDLKPENLFVTNDGRVKILDFGLAKQTTAISAKESQDSTPTRTMGTGPGVTLGTVGYMSPEQVRGEAADHRADIFSFGAVLYEMATGKRAFKGATAVETMNAILKEEPPEAEQSLSGMAGGLERILRHCLEKNPAARYQSARDLAFQLGSLSDSGQYGGLRAPEVRSLSRPWRVGVTLGIAVLVGAFIGRRFHRSEARGGAAPDASFTQLTFQSGSESQPSLSPDGATFVFVRENAGINHIYLQRVEGSNALDLTPDETRGASQPAFSPNGNQIAFRSDRNDGGLYLMGATGESVKRLTDGGFHPAWSPDGTEIVYATGTGSNPYSRPTESQLWIVTIATGAKRLLCKEDAVQPSWSPHGQRIAFWRLLAGTGQRDIWTIPAAGGVAVTVTHDAPLDWNPIWSHDGGALYFGSDRDGILNLWRVAIDEKSGKVTGPLERFALPALRSGHFSFSKDGRRLIYTAMERSGSLYALPFDPVRGKVAGEPRTLFRSTSAIPFQAPGIAPDGKTLIFTLQNQQENLYTLGADGSGLQQLTRDEFRNRGPDWSPDGKRIAFYSNRGGPYDIWSINPDGSGLTQMTQSPAGKGSLGPIWSPDGTHMAVSTNSGWGSKLVDLKQALGPVAFQPLPAMPDPADSFLVRDWSPDGKWLAGISVRPNQFAVNPKSYVYSIVEKRYFPLTTPGGFDGMSYMVWLNDSRRLVYWDEKNRLMLTDRVSGQTALLYDGASRNLKAPIFTRLAPDNRTIYFAATENEADIWMMTLP